MNERIIKIGLESGMLNYVDNETPRHYFLSGHADEQDLAKFAELIVQECADFIDSKFDISPYSGEVSSWADGNELKEHFGVEQ